MIYVCHTADSCRIASDLNRHLACRCVQMKLKKFETLYAAVKVVLLMDEWTGGQPGAMNQLEQAMEDLKV